MYTKLSSFALQGKKKDHLKTDGLLGDEGIEPPTFWV